MADPGPGRPADGSAPADAASFDDIVRTVWKWRRSVALAFVASMVVVAAITVLLPKVYTASALVLVNPSEGAGSAFEASQDSQVLGKTYAELFQSPAVVDEVVARLPYDYTRDALLGATSVTPVSGSQLLEVQAEAGSKSRAAAVANTYAEVFVDSERTVRGVGDVDLTVAAAAVEPEGPSRPKPRLYLLVGAFLSAFLAIGAALLRERRFQGLHVSESTTQLLGVPVIGRISTQPKLAPPLSLRDPSGQAYARESFRSIYADPSFAAAEGGLSVAVVSSGAGEGKTLCAVQLALAASEFDLSVLLVDADLRQGGLSAQLPASGSETGLAQLLAGDGSGSAKTAPIAGADVRVMPAGVPGRNPLALLRSEALVDFNRSARDRFGLVVYDTPPLMSGADASLIASRCDGAILVVDAGRDVQRSHIVRALDQLGRAGAEVFGVVLNRVAERQIWSSRRHRAPARDDGAPPAEALPAAPDGAAQAERANARETT